MSSWNKLYQYPYLVTPEIQSGGLAVRKTLFKYCSKQLKEIYGECFFSGDSLYGINEIKQLNYF